MPKVVSRARPAWRLPVKRERSARIHRHYGVEALFPSGDCPVGTRTTSKRQTSDDQVIAPCLLDLGHKALVVAGIDRGAVQNLGVTENLPQLRDPSGPTCCPVPSSPRQWVAAEDCVVRAESYHIVFPAR